MFVSKLPPKPDFDMLAASADRRTFVLALMGNLICSWSNNALTIANSVQSDPMASMLH